MRRNRGFTFLELAIAMLVLAVLMAGLAMPLAAQVAQRRADETARRLDHAREALLAFAAVHARLPCPADGTGGGNEAFAAGSGAHDGRCADFHGGYLPAATLGLPGLDAQGYLRDAWETPASRIRYAVAGNTVAAIPAALTRASGMQAASIAALGAEPAYLFVCASGTAAGPNGCGPAANQLTRRAAFVLVAAGANATDASPGPDERRNTDADAVFVQRPQSEGPGGFDDLVTWVPIHLLVSRLVTAGRLP